MNELPFTIEGFGYTKVLPYPFNIEVWKPLVYPEISDGYMISSIGRIYSTYYNKIMKTHLDKNGYKRICLSINHGIGKNFSIHRLVAYNFNAPPYNYKELVVNHIIPDKLLNWDTNLEWVTTIENVRHSNATVGNPINNPRLMDTEQAKKAIDLMMQGYRDTYILEILNIPKTPSTISILENIRKKVSYRELTTGLSIPNSKKPSITHAQMMTVIDCVIDEDPISVIYQKLYGMELQTGEVADFKMSLKKLALERHFNQRLACRMRFRFIKDRVAYICSMLQDGKSEDDIIKGLIENKWVDADIKPRLLHNMVARVRNRESFHEITKDYEY